MAGSVVVKDHGYAAYMANLRKAKSVELTVGLHAEEAEGEAMEAAERNEFGSPGGMIPARPAITGWGEENEERVPKEGADQMAKALHAKADPLERLDQLAQKYAGEIQSDIASGIQPENAESTVAKKGSSTPLIDRGTFRSSIRGRLRPA